MVSDSEDMELEDPPRKRRKKTAPLRRRNPTRKPPEILSFFTKNKDRAKRILAPLSPLKKDQGPSWGLGDSESEE